MDNIGAYIVCFDNWLRFEVIIKGHIWAHLFLCIALHENFFVLYFSDWESKIRWNWVGLYFWLFWKWKGATSGTYDAPSPTTWRPVWQKKNHKSKCWFNTQLDEISLFWVVKWQPDRKFNHPKPTKIIKLQREMLIPNTIKWNFYVLHYEMTTW